MNEGMDKGDILQIPEEGPRKNNVSIEDDEVSLELDSQPDVENPEQVEKEETAEKLDPKEEVRKFPENFKVEELVEWGTRLCNVLKDREDRRLTPLIEEEDLRRLQYGFNLLVEAVGRKNIEEVDQTIHKLTKCLDGICQAQTRGPLREDIESLNRVLFTLKELGRAAMDLKLHKLSDTVEQKFYYLQKKKSILEEY